MNDPQRPACQAELEPDDFSVHRGSGTDNIEVRFECDDCHATGYTFIPLRDFVLD